MTARGVRRSPTRLPEPRQAIPRPAALRSTTWGAIARACDARLERAEQLIREVSCMFADINHSAEAETEDLADELLKLRRQTAQDIREQYCDRLGESAL